MSKHQCKSSAELHIPRARIESSHLSHAKCRDRRILTASRFAILAVISISILAVILTILSSYFYDSERAIKQKFSTIVSDYYENYYYPQLIGNSSEEASLEEIMSIYAERGFAKISLRQLLLFDNERYADTAPIITDYCNENTTAAQIFPKPPFGPTDYRVKYHYSCTF